MNKLKREDVFDVSAKLLVIFSATIQLSDNGKIEDSQNHLKKLAKIKKQIGSLYKDVYSDVIEVLK